MDHKTGGSMSNRNWRSGMAGTLSACARLACGSLVAALAACATTGDSSIPEPAQLTSAVNGRFAGGSLQAVIDRYGPPSSDFMAAGDIHVFLWPASTTVRLHEPVASTTTGRIGSATYPSRPVPYTQTTTTRVGYDANYACTMQVGVKPDATVDGIGFDGRMGACAVFMP